MFSKWMPLAMKWGSALGEWIIKDKANKFEDDPAKKDVDEMSFWEKLSGLSNGKIVFQPVAADDTDGSSVSIPDEDPIKNVDQNAGVVDKDDTRTLDEKLADGLKDKNITTGTIDTDTPFPTKDTDAIKAIKELDYHEGQRIKNSDEEDARVAAEKAAKEQVIKDEEERLAAVAENKTNYDESTPARKEISDRQKAANDANEKRAADNAASNKYEAPKETTTYAQDRQAEYDSMTGFSREDGGDNARSTYTLDIEKRKQEKIETGTSGVGGLGEFAGMKWTPNGLVKAANGFDGMVNSPTMFLAGEAGAEHVKVTPSGSGGGSNITVNIQNMNGSDNDLRKLKKTILEVMQESSSNRGRL